MKTLWTVIACFGSAIMAIGQPFTLPKPVGWGTEIFALPPSFAPTITYKGKEHLRFSPGWADSTAEGYWAYVFAWEIDGAITTNRDSLRQQLIAYYDGLYLANKKQPPAGYGPYFTQVRITPNLPWPQDSSSFTGKVYTYNYLTGRQLDLLLKVHVRPHRAKKHTVILFEVSPKPYSHTTWKTLEPIVAGARF